MNGADTLQPTLRVRGLFKSYGTHQVLRGIDLTVMPGQTVAIIGASGSGKSTLLRCINYLERPTAGSVEVNGEAIGVLKRHGRVLPARERHLRRHRAEIGMVFQQYNLFPHMTALGNVIEAPMVVRRLSRTDATARATTLLTRVGLADKMNAYPAQLSGGQQQRVAIARALALQPQIMLFDEVTSALDPELVGEVLGVMQELARSGMTMLVVTHEMAFAADVADHVVFMDDGVIVEAGPPAEVLRRPQQPRTRAFLRRLLREPSVGAA